MNKDLCTCVYEQSILELVALIVQSSTLGLVGIESIKSAWIFSVDDVVILDVGKVFKWSIETYIGLSVLINILDLVGLGQLVRV